MNYDSLSWPSAPDGHMQGIQRQLGIDAAPSCPTNHLAREQVNHRCQIQPSLVGADVGDVSHPNFIGLIYGELL